jgi:hypothetical protein
MRKLFIPAVAGMFVLAGLATRANAAIKGEYIESRSADVYTGPCFANSEVGLTGKEAILAWKVKEGAWKGTNLNGLSVVGVVKASATLGDPYHKPYPAKSILLVDGRATREQRQALKEFAQANSNHLLDDVIRVEAVPIEFQLGEGHHGSAKLVAGNIARIETRSLCSGDDICGNEFVYYQPLVKLAHATPEFTVNDSFRGQGLGVVWNHVGKRSAFVGSFTL